MTLAVSKTTTPRLVSVHWIDAVIRDVREAHPVHAITVGYLLDVIDDGRNSFLRVAGEIFADGDARSVTALPLSMVRRVHYHKTGPLPREFDGWHAR